MEHNYMNEPKPTNRIIEMILGITGSIFGIIGGLIALILTNYDKKLWFRTCWINDYCGNQLYYFISNNFNIKLFN